MVETLISTREALARQTAPRVSRYLRLSELLTGAQDVAGGDEAKLIADLAQLSPSLSELIEIMRFADEAVDNGIAAIERLLTAPPRSISVEDGVVLLGRFAGPTDAGRGRLVILRWRLSGDGPYVDVDTIELDEVVDHDARAFLATLAEIATDLVGSARARAAVIVGPRQLEIEDVDALRRRFRAIGVVEETAVEVLPVTDVRDLSGLDRALAERGFDVLALWVDGQDQWAWRRARQFEPHHGIARALVGGDLDQVGASLADVLLETVEPPDEVEHEDIAIDSSLGEDEQAAVRSTVRAGLKIVFVGGNETQAAYRDSIEKALRERFGAGIVISWHGGWSSNWDEIANAVERDMEDSAAVVLMAYVRTGLGAQVRDDVDAHGIPWVPCTGGGRQSMYRAVEQALLIVASRDG